MLIKNQIKEAKSLYSKEQATAASTRNDIYFEIQQAYYSMIEKKNSIPVSFLGLKQAKENYELSYGRYKVGVGNPVELKEAQVQYQDAMLQYYNSLYQYNSARAELEKYIGKNIADGEVKLDTSDKNNSKKKSK
jgi:outer membrane protein TolC